MFKSTCNSFTSSFKSSWPTSKKMELEKNIYNGAYFLDHTHYDTVYKHWEKEKDFQWTPIPQIYFSRLSKSSQTSTNFRTLGNEFYSKKEINSALRYYSLALLFSQSESPERALAYANRSALLLEMEEYEQSLEDVTRALESKNILEENIKAKLTQRKVKLEQKIDYFQNDEKKLFFDSFKIQKENEFIKGAEESVNIKEDTLKGRRLIAMEDFKSGKLLALDSGYSVINDKILNFDTLHCGGCSKTVLNGIVGESIFSLYCSNKCMEATQAIPGLEDILKYSNSTEKLHSLDILLCIKLILQTKDFTLQEKPNNSHNNSKYSSVHSLCGHKKEEEENPELIYKSIFLSHLITSFVPSLKVKKLSKLILKNLQSLKYNMITLSEWCTEEGPLRFRHFKNNAKKHSLKIHTNSYATSLFTLIALCNHSCDPNCIFLRNDSNSFGYLIGTKPITKGEDLCISYKSPWTRMGFQERFNYLKENYKFECGCYGCINRFGVQDILEAGDEGVQENLRVLREMMKDGKLVEAWKLFIKVMDYLGGVYESRVGLVQGTQEIGRRCAVEILNL